MQNQFNEVVYPDFDIPETHKTNIPVETSEYIKELSNNIVSDESSKHKDSLPH